MSLMKKKSLKEVEIESAKPQSLSIAYSMSKRKKMASGGKVEAVYGKEPLPKITSKEEMDAAQDLPEQSAEEYDPKQGTQTHKGEDLDQFGEPIKPSGAKSKFVRSVKDALMAEGGRVSDPTIDDQITPEEMDMIMAHREEKAMMAESMPSIDDAKSDSDLDMVEHDSSISGAIRRKKMAKGGEVDLQANADEDLNKEDHLSYEAARKKTYFDDSQISEQPMDSNEHGDELSDEDAEDMISSIRSRMKSKR